jgi:hypothetical protein
VGTVDTIFVSQLRVSDDSEEDVQHNNSTPDVDLLLLLLLTYTQTIEFGMTDEEGHTGFGNVNDSLFLFPYEVNSRITGNPGPIFLRNVMIMDTPIFNSKGPR